MSVRDNLMINENTDEEAGKLAELLKDAAKKEDVQEILEKVEDIRAIQSENKTIVNLRANGVAGKTSATLLDITGSGALCAVYLTTLYALKSSTAWVKITVDGEVYSFVTFKNSSGVNAYNMGFVMVAVGFQRLCFNNAPVYYFGTGTGLGQVSPGAIYPVGTGEVTISRDGSMVSELYVPSPLVFKESLKIEVYQSGASANQNGEIVYYLD